MPKARLFRFECAYDVYGSGAPLVLVHGFPLDRSIWEPLRPHLEAYFRVIALDLPGFGESSVCDEKLTFDCMTQAVESIIQHFGESAYVAGHSMGGYVALALARRFPARVRGLGLVSTQALPDTPERKAARYASAAQAQEQGLGELAANMSARLSANPQHAPAIKELILRQRPITIAEALGAMAERPNSTPGLAGFHFPVSIVHGLEDVLIAPERSREMKAAIPHAALTEIPGVGHLPMLEAPEQTALALRALLVN